MRDSTMAFGAVAATFLLLVLGGLVHATGSALACPDWPLCGVDVSRTEIVLQVAHRGAAVLVGLLTVALAAAVRRRDAPTRALANGAVAAVVAQGALGALAVRLSAPPAVAVGHLALSLALLGAVIAVAARLRPIPAPVEAPLGRGLVAAAALAAVASVLLGGLVRHGGAAAACGAAGFLCQDALWPATGAAQLQTLHRLAAVAAAALTLGAALRAGVRALLARDGDRGLLAFGAVALVLAQVALGQWTLLSGLSAAVATAHLAVGALLVADLLALFLSLAPAARAAPLTPPR